MSPEDRERMLAFVDEHFPEMYDELLILREEGSPRFERRMMRLAPEMRRLMELLEVDPEIGLLTIRERGLDLRIRFAAQRYWHATREGDRTALRERIRGLMREAFDCRITRRQREINDLERQLTALKARLENAKAHRDEMVDERMRRWLDERAAGSPLGDGDEPGEPPIRQRGRPGGPRRHD
jgi:hypothetical protein